jgi:hypothetical protein
MKCPNCKKDIRGANKHKVKGVWYHKVCPPPDKMIVMKERTPGFSTELVKLFHKKHRKIGLRRKIHGEIEV